jgi:glutaredoxin
VTLPENGSTPVASIPMRVVLYTRAGCLLCDAARDVLLAERSRSLFELLEVDVAGHEDLEREYGIRIPVVEIDGEERFEYEVDPVELVAIVQGG